ncbi:MAG TPA: OB-fold domain-containing protein [Natronosporangium sp.]
MSATVERPGPPAEGLAGEYFGWHARGEFRLQRCDGCQRWHHPPVLTCPACGSEQLSWQPASGRGEVFTWTVTHHPFHPAFSAAGPYPCVVVTTEEGPRVLSTVRDVAPAQLRAGLPVQVDFEPAGDGAVAVFRPRAGAA